MVGDRLWPLQIDRKERIELRKQQLIPKSANLNIREV
jgi:hypothetical protein